MCGTTHKTVKRIIEKALAGDKAPPRKQRQRNFDQVADLVADKVSATHGKISAKRLLPLAQAAGASVEGGRLWLCGVLRCVVEVFAGTQGLQA